MERLEEISNLEVLRNANERFRDFFARFGGLAVEGNQEELKAMLQIEHTLRSVGALIRSGLPAAANRALSRELGEYRENLLRLREELRKMESSATACRSRLSSREQHLRATQAWCAAARSTR